jgi:hypothetical protein
MSQNLNSAVAVIGIDIGKNPFHVRRGPTVEDEPCLIADYTHAIELNPRHSAAYNGRSKAFEARGEFDRADADRKKAIELGP